MSKVKAVVEKNRILISVFALSLFVFAMVYSLFFRDYFVPDLITSDMGGYLTAKPGPYYWYFKGGRPMTFFIAWINYFFVQVGVTPLHNSWVLQLINIIIMATITVIIYNLYAKYITDRKSINWILYALVLMIFVNPMYMENIVFHGYDLAIGVLFAALASKKFVDKKYISATVLLIMSVCIYQVYFELFLIWTTTALMLSVKDKVSKAFVLNYISMGFIAVVALLFNIISQKLVLAKINRDLINDAIESAELSGTTVDIDTVYQMTESKPYNGIGESGIYGLLKPALCAIKAIFKDLSYPSCLAEIITACACVLILVMLIKNKKRVSEIIITAVVLFAMSFYYVVIYLSGSTDYAGRIIWPFYACVSGVLIYLFSLLISEKAVYRKILKIVIAAVLALVIYNCNIYATDFFINQSLSRQVMADMETEIERYEQETGNAIKTIYVKGNGDYKYYSKYLIGKYNFDAYSFNVRPESIAWSDVELLNWLTGQKYTEEEMSDEMYADVFGNKSWIEFNASEQMIFEGNTLYWAKY